MNPWNPTYRQIYEQTCRIADDGWAGMCEYLSTRHYVGATSTFLYDSLHIGIRFWFLTLFINVKALAITFAWQQGESWNATKISSVRTLSMQKTIAWRNYKKSDMDLYHVVHFLPSSQTVQTHMFVPWRLKQKYPSPPKPPHIQLHLEVCSFDKLNNST